MVRKLGKWFDRAVIAYIIVASTVLLGSIAWSVWR